MRHLHLEGVALAELTDPAHTVRVPVPTFTVVAVASTRAWVTAVEVTSESPRPHRR